MTNKNNIIKNFFDVIGKSKNGTPKYIRKRKGQTFFWMGEYDSLNEALEMRYNIQFKWNYSLKFNDIIINFLKKYFIMKNKNKVILYIECENRESDKK